MIHERTNHIDIKYHYVCNVVAQGKLKVCKLSTHDNSADMIIRVTDKAYLLPYDLRNAPIRYTFMYTDRFHVYRLEFVPNYRKHLYGSSDF